MFCGVSFLFCIFSYLLCLKLKVCRIFFRCLCSESSAFIRNECVLFATPFAEPWIDLLLRSILQIQDQVWRFFPIMPILPTFFPIPFSWNYFLFPLRSFELPPLVSPFSIIFFTSYFLLLLSFTVLPSSFFPPSFLPSSVLLSCFMCW